jgi:sporulation protein YlmC with PRC-barrel domain
MDSIISVKNLTDYQVLDRGGETIGTVEDVMLDAGLGHTRYFVLVTGKPLRKERYAVPASRMTLDSENEALVVDVPFDSFKDARAFDTHTAATEADAVYRLEEH